jgi:hypothetical protein
MVAVGAVSMVDPPQRDSAHAQSLGSSTLYSGEAMVRKNRQGEVCFDNAFALIDASPASIAANNPSENRNFDWNFQVLKMWILQTGAAWRFLPDEFPSPATCWRRLKQWEDEGVWLDAWRALLGALDEEGLLQWDETFLDGSFAPAKRGAPPSVKPSGARVRSGWYWSTVKVFRWEFGWKVPLRQKLRLRKPPSPKSEFHARKGGRGKTPSV